MRILVTGSTGFVGRRLGLELVREGHEVVALVRDKERADLPFPAELRLWANREEPLRDIDAIIHLAGESIAKHRWSAEEKAKIQSSRTDTTHELHERIAKMQGRKPKVFISASAVGYYGDRADEWLSETSAPGKGFLAETCVAWERAVHAGEAILPRVVIFRFGMVLGRYGGALAEIAAIFKWGLGGKLGGGRQWLSWIHLEDLVQLLLFALRTETLRGVYNAVAPSPVRNEEFTRTLSGALGVPAVLPAPKFVLQLALGERSHLLLDSQRVSAEKILQAGFRFRYEKLSEALAAVFQEVEKTRGVLCCEFHSEQWIPRSIHEVFEFFSLPKNFEPGSSSPKRLLMLNHSTPRIREGTTFDCRLKLFGFPIQWKSLVFDWKENQAYATTQKQGPFAFWLHTHSFERLGSGTLVIDRVLYRLPFGALGCLLGRPWVRKALAEMFRCRREEVRACFSSHESGKPKPSELFLKSIAR